MRQLFLAVAICLSVQTNVAEATSPANFFMLAAPLSVGTVFGDYRRERVTGTTSYPFNTVGRIATGCTGTLIGRRVVVTAAHCLYNYPRREWKGWTSFAPGQNGDNYPYGEIDEEISYVPSEYTSTGSFAYDYGVLVLKEAVGRRTGWLGLSYMADVGNGRTINLVGYPGDKPDGTQWKVNCPIASDSNGEFRYRCDSIGGMSGSAIYVKSGDQRTIYGIHAFSGATRNGGPAFTAAAATWIINKLNTHNH